MNLFFDFGKQERVGVCIPGCLIFSGAIFALFESRRFALFTCIFGVVKFFFFYDSPGFLRFVNVLCNLTGDERKAFLQFTTGCSSLPPGGLANLTPRLTIVRKVSAYNKHVKRDHKVMIFSYFCR